MSRKILLIGLAVALAALPAAASTFVAMSDAELVAASDAVVQGEVGQVYSFWNHDGTAILTEAVIHVEEVLAGDAPAALTVRTFGGEVAGYRLEAHGFPTFQQGERAILFLSRASDGSVRVTGYRLGQYRVRPGAGGETLAVPAMEPGIRLLFADGTPAPAPKAVPVAAFKNQIRALAAQRPTRGIVK